MDRRYVTATEFAALRRCSVDALRQERHRGKGPPFMRSGRVVLYAVADVERWFAEHTHGAPARRVVADAEWDRLAAELVDAGF